MMVVAAGGVVHRQKQIVAALQAAGATSADRATTPATIGVHEGLAFRVLLGHAILREAGDQRVYLDESRWESHEQKRRRLGFIIPGLVLLAGIVFWMIYR